MNAAVWFGAAIFFTFAAGTAPFSQTMRELLGVKNYPYFSGAIAQIFIARYFRLQLVCAIIAILHLLCERAYLGRTAHRLSIGLLAALFAATIIGGSWMQPTMKRLH